MESDDPRQCKKMTFEEYLTYEDDSDRVTHSQILCNGYASKAASQPTIAKL